MATNLCSDRGTEDEHGKRKLTDGRVECMPCKPALIPKNPDKLERLHPNMTQLRIFTLYTPQEKKDTIVKFRFKFSLFCLQSLAQVIEYGDSQTSSCLI